MEHVHAHKYENGESHLPKLPKMNFCDIHTWKTACTLYCYTPSYMNIEGINSRTRKSRLRCWYFEKLNPPRPERYLAEMNEVSMNIYLKHDIPT